MKPSEPWTEIGRYEHVVEVVEFNGCEYRRLINSKMPSSRNYFRATGSRKLHRDIWEYHNGPIPEGYHIHHKDGNTLNNDLSNLELLSPKDHAAVHGDERSDSSEWLTHLESIRPLARAGRKIVEATCVVCGKEFTAVLGRHPKFCSDACTQMDYRRQGKGLKELACVVCEKAFLARHANQPTCSKECGATYAWSKKREELASTPGTKKICPVCNGVFEDKSHHQRKIYCSDDCHRFHTRPLKNVKKRAAFFKKKGIPDPKAS